MYYDGRSVHVLDNESLRLHSNLLMTEVQRMIHLLLRLGPFPESLFEMLNDKDMRSKTDLSLA